MDAFENRKSGWFNVTTRTRTHTHIGARCSFPAPHGSVCCNSDTSFSAGEELSVNWFYVGDNSKFDIYLRQDDRRVSDNLCAGKTGGSCTTSNAGEATVTIPAEVEDGADYRLLVCNTTETVVVYVGGYSNVVVGGGGINKILTTFVGPQIGTTMMWQVQWDVCQEHCVFFVFVLLLLVLTPLPPT